MGSHYKILSINGGGVRGIVPAKIIERITTITDKPIHELFDYVIGTSAGGIIAVSLTVKNEDGSPKFSTSDVVQIFKEEVQQIFYPGHFEGWPVLSIAEQFFRGIGQFFAPKYSRDGIDNLLELKLGDATFLNTTMPVTTVSYSLDSDGPRLWSKYRAENEPDYHNYLLRDAAGATSAAPTYFPPKITKTASGEVFHDIDGGIFANSPTMIGVSEFLKAQTIQMHSDKVTVLSIGTGRFKDNPGMASKEDSSIFSDLPIGPGLTTGIAACALSLGYSVKTGMIGVGIVIPLCVSGMVVGGLWDGYSNFGGLGWIAHHGLVDKMMKGAEISDAFQSKLVDVIRINPVFDQEYSSMDDSSKTHLQRFEKEIDNFIKKHNKVLGEVARCLESQEGEDECVSARSHTAQFGEDFYVELTGSTHHIDF